MPAACVHLHTCRNVLSIDTSHVKALDFSFEPPRRRRFNQTTHFADIFFNCMLALNIVSSPTLYYIIMVYSIATELLSLSSFKHNTVKTRQNLFIVVKAIGLKIYSGICALFNYCCANGNDDNQSLRTWTHWQSTTERLRMHQLPHSTGAFSNTWPASSDDYSTQTEKPADSSDPFCPPKVQSFHRAPKPDIIIKEKK